MLERRILRLMCTGSLAAACVGALLRDLHGYRWRDPEHRIVYEALKGVRALQNLTLREQLPAQATRMGFPDVDWALYFAAGARADNEADAIGPEPKIGMASELAADLVGRLVGELNAATAKQP
jgi:hypothetical protein